MLYAMEGLALACKHSNTGFDKCCGPLIGSSIIISTTSMFHLSLEDSGLLCSKLLVGCDVTDGFTFWKEQTIQLWIKTADWEWLSQYLKGFL